MKKKTIGLSLVSILLITLTAIFAYYMSKGTPPAKIANAVITCTQTVCTSQATSPSCTQLNVAVTGCLSSANVAVCLAGVPSLIGVGYADVVCIVATLAETPSKAIATRIVSKSFKVRKGDKSGYPDDDETPKSLNSKTIQNNASTWLKSQQVNVLLNQ